MSVEDGSNVGGGMEWAWAFLLLFAWCQCEMVTGVDGWEGNIGLLVWLEGPERKWMGCFALTGQAWRCFRRNCP